MRTKKEIIDFLESKVGTKVVCVGNTKLSGECVTLIKSLMEFLGVPDPYKARGNANTCVTTYINEGIAKPGLGFISVFSNKTMAGGVGHVWCNAGDGDGVFYESNGVKPLIVTKGKTYSYDTVANFDAYIAPNTNPDLVECELHKNNLQNQVNGLLVDLSKKDKLIEEISSQLTEAKTSSDGFRKELNDFIADCARKLDTRQEKVEILASIDTCITYEDKASELDRQLALERKEHASAVDTLEAKIKALELNLETLKAEFKALKETTKETTPTTHQTTTGLWDIIIGIFGGKYGKK